MTTRICSHCGHACADCHCVSFGNYNAIPFSNHRLRAGSLTASGSPPLNFATERGQGRAKDILPPKATSGGCTAAPGGSARYGSTSYLSQVEGIPLCSRLNLTAVSVGVLLLIITLAGGCFDFAHAADSKLALCEPLSNPGDDIPDCADVLIPVRHARWGRPLQHADRAPWNFTDRFPIMVDLAQRAAPSIRRFDFDREDAAATP